MPAIDRGGRDFAIDVLHVLNARFEDVKMKVSQRGDIARVTPEIFTECFVEGIVSRAEEGHQGVPHEKDLFRKLLELHSNIDAWGRGWASWDEILTYLIETTMSGRADHVPENLKPYMYYSHRVPRFSGNRCIRWLTEKSKTVLIGRSCEAYDITEGRRDASLTVPPTPDPASLLDVLFLFEHHVSVASFTDLTLRVYATWRGCTLKKKCIMGESILCLAHSQKASQLYTGTRTGRILAYSTQSLLKDEADPAPLFKAHHHTAALTQIIVHANIISGASLDGTISIMDTNLNLLYVLSRKSGVSGITRMALIEVRDDGTSFLATCGFEHHARMWMIREGVQPFILRDSHTPHATPVVDICTVQNPPHVVTLDRSGMFKVWDAKNWRAFQTIKCDPQSSCHNHKWVSLCYDADHNCLSTATSRDVLTFTYGSLSTEACTADDAPLTACCLDLRRNILHTASQRTLRSWSLLSGKLFLFQPKIVPRNITTLTVCDTGRRLYIGSEEGAITCHNSSSGVFIKCLCTEGAEVHTLIYGTGRRFIIALRWDSSIQVYYEAALEGTALGNLPIDPRCFAAIEGRCIAFSDVLNRVAVGDRKGFVTVWEAKVRRNEEFGPIQQLQVPSEGVDVTLTFFLTGYPLLVTVDGNSLVVIWQLPPSPASFEVLCRFKLPHTITACSWYWPKSLLYFATSHGRITVFSIHKLLNDSGFTSFCSSLAAMDNLKYEYCSSSSAMCEPVEVQSKVCHTQTVQYLDVDVICKYVVSGSTDRTVKIWTMGLEPIGRLDQSQRSYFNIPVSYCDVHTHQGDRVSVWNEMVDDVDESEASVTDGSLPGEAWGKGIKVDEREAAWYAAGGWSVLLLASFGGDVVVTQNTFRTHLCNEAIAKLREAATDAGPTVAEHDTSARVSLRRSRKTFIRRSATRMTLRPQKAINWKKRPSEKKETPDVQTTRPMRAAMFAPRGKHKEKILKTRLAMLMASAHIDDAQSEWLSSASSGDTSALSSYDCPTGSVAASAAAATSRSTLLQSSGCTTTVSDPVVDSNNPKSMLALHDNRFLSIKISSFLHSQPSARSSASPRPMSARPVCAALIEEGEEGMTRKLSSMGLMIRQSSFCNSDCDGVGFVSTGKAEEMTDAAERRQTLMEKMEEEDRVQLRKDEAGPDEFVFATSAETMVALRKPFIDDKNVVSSHRGDEPDKRCTYAKSHVGPGVVPKIPSMLLAAFSSKWDDKQKTGCKSGIVKRKASSHRLSCWGSIHWDKVTAAAATKKGRVTTRETQQATQSVSHNAQQNSVKLLASLLDYQSSLHSSLPCNNASSMTQPAPLDKTTHTRHKVLASPLFPLSPVACPRRPQTSLMGIRQLPVTPAPLEPIGSVLSEIRDFEEVLRKPFVPLYRGSSEGSVIS